MDGRFYIRGSLSGSKDDGQRICLRTDWAIKQECNNECVYVLLRGKTPVTGDTSIIVMKQNIVVIDMNKSIFASEVNESVFAAAISSLTGIDTSKILIELEVDEEGYVITVIVYLPDVDECESVVAAVNKLDKGGQCNTSVLCRSKSTRLIVPEDEMSRSARNCLPFSLFFFLFLFIVAII